MAKKINLTKSDTAESAVIKLLKSKEDDLVLVIPNFSKFANSLENFEFLRKEAEDAGKTIAIESVDDMVVEFAKRSDLEATNPFFQEKTEKNIHQVSETENDNKKEKPFVIKDIPLKEIEEDIGDEDKKHHYGRWLAVVSLLILIIPGVYFSYKYLPEAKIKIVTKKMDWQFKDSLLVDKSTVVANLESNTLPGQALSKKENATLLYKATGNKRVNRKATGTVTIYNNYGTEPQQLVASTRLTTPDGKMFRLAESVNIPGAKKEGDKLIASSIEVKVIADRGGEEYNIGPNKFTIPGFAKDKKKYVGFYAVSTLAMKGGYVGDSAYPSDDDIKEAKKNSASTLENNIKSVIKNQISEGFKVIDGASKFTLVKQIINPDVNEENKFSIYTEGELSMVIFNEKDALSLLNKKANKELSANLKPKTSSIEYGQPKPDFVKGTMVVPVVYKSQLEYPIDKEKLKKELVGKSEIELKALLFAMPGLLSANISFWPPIFVNRVPEQKVDIEIE